MKKFEIVRASVCVILLALLLPIAASSEVKKPWAKHCTLTGIPASPHGKEKFDLLMQDFARECAPVHACVLACMRNHCDVGAGGCFHDCGGQSDYGPPEVLADMYAAKDKRVCP